LEKRLWRCVLLQKLGVFLVYLLLVIDLISFGNIRLLVVWGSLLYYILNLTKCHRCRNFRCVVGQSRGSTHTHQILFKLFDLIFSHLNFVSRINSMTHFYFLVLRIMNYRINFLPLLSCRPIWNVRLNRVPSRVNQPMRLRPFFIHFSQLYLVEQSKICSSFLRTVRAFSQRSLRFISSKFFE
jgi:hypothetical protein